MNKVGNMIENTDNKFYKLPQHLTLRADLTLSAKIVYAVILDSIGQNKKSWIGKRSIMQKTALADKTVCDAIRRLEDANLLQVDRRGNGKSSIYSLSESGSEIKPVQKSNQFKNYTPGGSESEPEAVQKVNPNQTDQLNQTYKGSSRTVTEKKKKSRSRFQKPSIEELQVYFTDQGCPATEARKFYDYYESNGWKVGGRAAMKDWKAAVRTWISRDRDRNQKRPLEV